MYPNARRLCATVSLLAMAVTACSHDEIQAPARDVALAPATAANYTISLLQLPPFSTNGAALGINDAGWVVGWTDSAGGKTGRAPTLWKPGAAPVRLYVDPQLPEGAATDINRYGDVVGFTGGFGNPFAFGYVWPVSGKRRQGPLSQFTPLGLNAAGYIVGKMCTGGRCAAGRQNVTTTTNELPCPGEPWVGGCSSGVATSVNDRDEVAGTYWQGGLATGSVPRAIVWTADDFILDMANLSGNRAGSEAAHISNALNVSGAHFVAGKRRPVVWYLTANTWREFGNGAEGTATSISDSNRVVGTVKTASGNMAFTATSVADFGTLPLLNSLFATSDAADVNSCGSIVGAMQTLYGRSVPVLWQVTYKGSVRCDTARPAP
jgi:hypothetical protein